jgi:hypothetical protein
MHTTQIIQYCLLTYIAAYSVYQIVSAMWWLIRKVGRR